jgi:hypothetical protein
MDVAIVLASMVFLVATAACMERLVRARQAATALLAVPPLIISWVVLWLLRLPPTPGHALLVFVLMDLALLGISVVAVVRLLGGFPTPSQSDEPDDDPGDDDSDADDELPPQPPPPPRSARPRPSRPARRGSNRPTPRPQRRTTA